MTEKRSGHHHHRYNKSPELAETTFTMTTIEEEENEMNALAESRERNLLR